MVAATSGDDRLSALSKRSHSHLASVRPASRAIALPSPTARSVSNTASDLTHT